jgi:hypothetical protein
MNQYTICKPKKNDYDEYVVKVKKGRKLIESKTYYTDDRADAYATYKQMTKWANKKNKIREHK